MQEGTVFNIQHFSIDDGPGIRTVVFLKGCPLRCRWCANPESQHAYPEVAWTKGGCIGCQSCVHHLKNLDCHFIPDAGLVWDNSLRLGEEEVRQIGRICPSEALHVIGKKRTVREVIDQVERDMPFYRTSGGGLTVSGGEPLMQPEFTRGLLEEAQYRQIHTCMETSGYAPWESFNLVAEKLNFLLMDVKCFMPKLHRKHTGVSNDRILENLKRVRERYPDLKIRIRTPVIPGVNDTEEEIAAISDLAGSLHCEYELLKYHRLGEPKYVSLHRPYPMENVQLEDQVFEKLRRFEIRLS